MKTLKHVALVLLFIIIWTAFIGYRFIDGFLLRSITSKQTTEAFMEAAKEKLDNVYVGNFAMVLLENNKEQKSKLST